MKKYIITASSLLLPTIVFAQGGFTKTKGLIGAVGGLISRLIIVVAGIALLVFLWGLVKFIFKSGDPEEIKAGKNLMKWGLVALFVMVSVWGIIGFMQGELGLEKTVNTGGANNNTINTTTNNSNIDPCIDAWGDPTYVGDCGTY